MIHDKFRRFGNIVKLLIFEKGEVTKFFIEFSEVEQAAKVKYVQLRQKDNCRERSFYQPSARWTSTTPTLPTSISRIRQAKEQTIHRRNSCIKISCKNMIFWPSHLQNQMQMASMTSSCNLSRCLALFRDRRQTTQSILQGRSLLWKFQKRIESENKTNLILRSRATFNPFSTPILTQTTAKTWKWGKFSQKRNIVSQARLN